MFSKCLLLNALFNSVNLIQTYNGFYSASCSPFEDDFLGSILCIWWWVNHCDVLTMDPRGNKVLHGFPSPLRSHVTDASDCRKIEVASVVLDESLHLALVDPGSPWLLDFPIKFLDPLAGSQSWHSTISIAREEKHLNVILVVEDAVDPEGCLVLNVPL